MSKRQQPSTVVFRNDYVELGFKLSLLGLNKAQLAVILCEGDEELLDHWLAEYDNFAAHVLKGQVHADAEVANAFFKSATGYPVRETRRRYTVDDKGVERLIYREETEKVVPPSVAAIELWLKTRQRELWPEDVRPRGPEDPGGKPIDTEEDPVDAIMGRLEGIRARVIEHQEADAERVGRLEDGGEGTSGDVDE